MKPRLPKLFLQRMERLLGNEFKPFLVNFEKPAPIGLRVNALKISPERFQALSPFPLKSIPWEKNGFLVIDLSSRPGKHPYHAGGLYYLQEPSAMAAVVVLAPQPGDRVLDIAAAPGGKATQIADWLAGKGILIANDPHPRRVQDLAGNIDRWGARNVSITNETPTRLADHFGAVFDKVLVDAPCSGEGMFRKDTASRYAWNPKLVTSCARRQQTILKQAARLVRPGGYLVYATCTFAPQENEEVIAKFIQDHSEFQIRLPPFQPGFSPGRPDWVKNAPEGLDKAIRLWPHHTVGEGHFIACLQRSPAALHSDELTAKPKPARIHPLADEYQSLFTAFLQKSHLNLPFSTEHLSLQGNRLYAIPTGGLDLHGLRVVHWGWWLGTFKKNRFEPSHALAMGMKIADVQQVLNFQSDDPDVLAYLRGEITESQGLDGWTLVAVDGYMLGWGKRIRGRLKSHSLKSFRWI